ncbi:MAG: hypothetical protein JRI25_29990, partial [Deltaproteobacteria bacterium]|nr:hypothetical protein [Deltaproteobacteria bacterium]
MLLEGPEVITAGQRAGLWVAVVCIGAGLALWWLSRSRRVSPTTLLDYALLFEVFGAFGILGAGFILTLGEVDFASLNFIGVSWVGVWIIGFAVIVPATRGKSILAAFAAASMGPLGALIGSVVHGVQIPVNVWLAVTVPDFLCAGIAVWLSGIVFRLGRRIHKAEQMGRYRLTKRLGRGGMG